jgi:RHS repeat-associated protein
MTLAGYDAAGRQVTATDAMNHTTLYVYDGDSHLVKTILPDGTFVQNAYDSQGRLTGFTDSMGRTTQYQYDAPGRLTGVVSSAVTDPSSGKTVNPTSAYTYDNYGDLTQIKDALGHTSQFTFDQFGHQLTHTLPLGQVETTSYDAFGRVSTYVDFIGQKTQYQYDSLGRVGTKTYFAAGQTSAGETVVYGYDTVGRLSQVVDTIGSNTRNTQYGYDLENRVTSVTTPEGTVNYAYDPTTGFHTRTYTTNSDITYAADALQRLSTATVTKQNGVTLTTPLVTTYYYTAVGGIDHVTYPNGTETDYGYDSLNRLTSVTNKKGTTQLSSYAYTIEADGLRTGVTEKELESDGSTSTVNKAWTYDALQRLTQEQVTSSITANSYTDNYTYDLVGNRLTKTHTQGGQTLTVNYTYNSNDQLSTESGSGASSYSTSYGYSANGSLMTISRTGSGAETDTYTYDLQNRLATANINRTENGQAVTIAASYQYDDSGPRAQGVVTTTVGSGSPTTTTTQYLADGGNPTGFAQVLEEHVNGASTPSISYLLGLSVFGQTNGSGATSYLMLDGQASTRLVVDGTGSILNRYSYDAFGNVLGQSLGVLNLPATSLLYTGQQFDPGLAQYYLRARYYDPRTGRFGGRDSVSGNLQLPLTLNKYAYALQDPANLADPSGLSWSSELGTLVHKKIYEFYKQDFPTHIYRFGQQIPGSLGRLFPDIVDATPTVKQIGEIKPLSIYGVVTGPVQLALYLAVANGTRPIPIQIGNEVYIIPPLPPWLGGGWSPSTWNIGVRPIFPGLDDPKFYGTVVYTLANVSGVIFYKHWNFRRLGLDVAYATAVALATRIASVVDAFLAAIPLLVSTLPDLELILDNLVYGLQGLAVAGQYLLVAGVLTGAAWGLYAGISALLTSYSLAGATA